MAGLDPAIQGLHRKAALMALNGRASECCAAYHDQAKLEAFLRLTEGMGPGI
jgi:hypothetical protein